MAVAATIQDNPGLLPVRNVVVHQPDRPAVPGRRQHDLAYLFKAQGSYSFPGTSTCRPTSTGTRGGTRTLTINGPGAVYGGTTGTITYNTLETDSRDTFRFER